MPVKPQLGRAPYSIRHFITSRPPSQARGISPIVQARPAGRNPREGLTNVTFWHGASRRRGRCEAGRAEALACGSLWPLLHCEVHHGCVPTA